MKPIDEVINEKLLPAIFGTTINDIDRELFTLPIRDGGLGMPILTETARSEYTTSTLVNAPLAAIFVMQGTELPYATTQKDIAQN